MFAQFHRPHTIVIIFHREKNVCLARIRVVVQSTRHDPAMMPIVLANDGLRLELPQARVVVRAGRDQVGRVGAEGAVPDPALVRRQVGLERELADGLAVRVLRVDGRGLGLDAPDARAVVRGAGRQVARVRREQDAVEVGGVGLEAAVGQDVGLRAGLAHAPDVDVTLCVL